jgi:hypothetical protein
MTDVLATFFAVSGIALWILIGIAALVRLSDRIFPNDGDDIVF